MRILTLSLLTLTAGRPVDMIFFLKLLNMLSAFDLKQFKTDKLKISVETERIFLHIINNIIIYPLSKEPMAGSATGTICKDAATFL